MLSAAPRRFLLPAAAGRIVLPALRDPLPAAGPPSVMPVGLPLPWRRHAPPERPLPAARGPAQGETWRSLAAALALAALLLSAGAWSLLHRELQATRSQLASAERRLALSEARQGSLSTELARRLTGELVGLREQAGAELEALATETRHAIDTREAQAKARLNALQASVRAGIALQARPAPSSDPGQALRHAFARARPATLYIRTRYPVRLIATGEVEYQTAFGTGFLVSPDGVAITAQHVLFPWRYDRRLLASQALGLVHVQEAGAQISVWLADTQVAADGSEDAALLDDHAYRRDADHAEVRILYVGEPARRTELFMTTAGPAALDLPQLGPGDVAVVQLMDPGRRFPALALSEAPAPGPLDDVLVVGFPLSRLQDGYAVPQVTVGRVRRGGGPLLELDAAVHPGNSGGPVLDRRGRVVGMASAILETPVYGLALPLDQLRMAWRLAREAAATARQPLGTLRCAAALTDGPAALPTPGVQDCGGALAAGP